MRILETEFTKFDDKFHQMKRESNICIYERTNKTTGQLSCYEVVIVNTILKTKQIKGRTIAEVGDEFYPGSERWGLEGWTFMDLDKALDKFNQLIQNNKVSFTVT